MIGPRLWASIVKETWAILRDPRARLILIAPPLIQLLIFGFASTIEIKNFSVGVLDRDNGRWSAEFVERLAGSPAVREIVPIASLQKRDDRDATLRKIAEKASNYRGAEIDTATVTAVIRAFRQMKEVRHG